MKVKKNIPNILTTIRIVSCIPLMILSTLSLGFIIIYILAGVCDILDGILARKLKAESLFGAKYDSIADLLFVVVCLIKILPILNIDVLIWIWIGVIALIKIINLISGYVYYKKMIFLHTKANKLTGLLLFLSPLSIQGSYFNYVVIILCTIALFAAIQEGHYIRTGNLEKEM